MSELTDLADALAIQLDNARQYLNVEVLESRIGQLEVEMARPDLWDDPDAARLVQTEHTSVKDDLDTFAEMRSGVEDLHALIELASEDGGEQLAGEAREMAASLAAEFANLELRALFTGEYDEGDALCEIHSGAGGTDSQDWAQMLLNMYQRWASDREYGFEMLDVQDGAEAGISSAEFVISGRHAYGMLQSERGVHRIVRISPFDSAARRHTSFASVAVVPFVADAVSKVEIEDKDLRIDTYRSSGAGGQHVNKTDSAVRITHIPTGIVVSCQNQRSQHQNKEVCLEMLAARLLALEEEKRASELASEAGEVQKVEWGSQIRSYVLAPYQLVKDERSQEQSSNPEAVLSGEVSGFMEAWLRWRRTVAEASSEG